MKKRLVLGVILLTQLAAVIPTYAAVKVSAPTVTIDGEKLKFSVDPIIEGGTTLVQFRPIFEKLGLEIKWDKVNQRITGTKADLQIELTIGSLTAVVNGKEITLQTAPKLVHENTVIPLRFVGEASGKDVGWNAVDQLVSIKDKAPGKADELTPNELKSFLQTTSRKQESSYSSAELSTLKKALATDKTKLFEMLVSQYDYKLSQASLPTDNIIQFVKKYLTNDLQYLVDYSLSVSESTEKGYAINQILDGQPVANNSDYFLPSKENFKMLSTILEQHPNAQVRYDLAYSFNRYINEEVFSEVLKAITIEKNDLVFGALAMVASNKAGIAPDRILLLFNQYNSLTASQKLKFNSTLTRTANRDLELKFAWKTFLGTKANTGTETEKKDASEIADFIVNGKEDSLYSAGSDEAKIQATMKQFTDSHTNKDIDAYLGSQVNVTEAAKKEMIQWYKDYSASNYSYTINNFDITSVDGNTAKAKVGFKVQLLEKTQIPDFDAQETQDGFFISQQSQFVENVTFTKSDNGEWKISNLDKTNWYNIYPTEKRMIFVELED